MSLSSWNGSGGAAAPCSVGGAASFLTNYITATAMDLMRHGGMRQSRLSIPVVSFVLYKASKWQFYTCALVEQNTCFRLVLVPGLWLVVERSYAKPCDVLRIGKTANSSVFVVLNPAWEA